MIHRVLLVGLFGLVSSVSAQPSPPPAPSQVGIELDLDVSSAPRVLTDDELIDVAYAWEDALFESDVELANAMVDYAAMSMRSCAQGEVSKARMLAVVLEMTESAITPTAIRDGIGAEGDYAFLGLVDRDGERRARFRLIGDDGGLNYQDVLFQAHGASSPRVTDLYAFTAGEDVSQSIGRMMRAMFEPNGDLRAGGDLTTEFVTAFQSGDLQRVVALYPRLSLGDEERRPLALLYVQASMSLDHRQLAKATEHFVTLYGQEATVDLLMIDVHVGNGDFEAMLEGVERLDAAIDDPYLDVLRASGLVSLGRYAEAMRAADRVVEAMPDRAQIHMVRLNTALLAGNHKAARDELVTLERDFGWEFSETSIEAEWSAFAASAPYAEWRKQRPGK